MAECCKTDFTAVLAFGNLEPYGMSCSVVLGGSPVCGTCYVSDGDEFVYGYLFYLNTRLFSLKAMFTLARLRAG
jgi:hypothetical protein